MRLPEACHMPLRAVLMRALEMVWSGLANNPTKATVRQQKRAQARADKIGRKSGGLGPLGVGLENFEDQLNQEDAGDDDDELPEMRGRSASKMAIAVVEKSKEQDDELPEER